MVAGKIYYLNYGGTEIVGRFISEDATNYYFNEYLHQWAGRESFRHGNNNYCIKAGLQEIREATQTEKQALLRKAIEYNTI